MGKWDFQTNLLIVGVVGETKSTVDNNYNSIVWHRGLGILQMSNDENTLYVFHNTVPTQVYSLRITMDQP